MSISDTSIKRNAPFSPSLWGFVSCLSDECPHKCLLIILVLADGPGHFALLRLRHTEETVGSFYPSFRAVTYFVKVNFRSFLALMGRLLYQFNSCVLSAIKAILSANVRCIRCSLSPSYANAFLLLVLEWRILDETPSLAFGDGL